MADRLIREADPPSGVLASPVPQVWDPTANNDAGGWVRVFGAHNAPRSILYGPNGQPINNENPLEVRVRQLETLLGALNAAKETNPDAASATLLALLRGLLATIAAIKGNDGIKKIADAVTVDGLNALATESTLGEVKSALAALGATSDAAETDPAETASQIALLKGLLTGLNTVAGTVDNGAAKVTLTGHKEVVLARLLPAQSLDPEVSYTTDVIDLSGIGNGSLSVFVRKNTSSNRNITVEISWVMDDWVGLGSHYRSAPEELITGNSIYGRVVRIDNVKSRKCRFIITNLSGSNSVTIEEIQLLGLM